MRGGWVKKPRSGRGGESGSNSRTAVHRTAGASIRRLLDSLRRGVILICGWLAMALGPAVAGAPAAEVQVLEAATFLHSDNPEPPREIGVAIALPDPWDVRHKDVVGYAWYFIDWPLASAPIDVQAVYLTAVTLPAQVFVNDTSVGLTGSLTGRRPRTWEQSQLFEIPANLIHAGRNRIAVRVHTPRAGVGGLGPIVAGTHEAVSARQRRDFMMHTVGPAIVSVIMVVVGFAVVGLWLRRRDLSYLLFGAAAVVWGLHTAATLLPEPLLPQPHWTIWWHAVYMLFVVMLCLFCVRFAGVRWHPYRRLALSFAVLVAPVLYLANAVGVMGEASVYVRLMGIALVGVALAAVARYAFQLRNAESLLLLATGATATALALHDWMLAQDPFAIRPLWLVPYSAFAFLVLVGWILIDRFVRALNEYELLNADLERRIAAKSASLEFQLEETRLAKNAAETADLAKSRFLAAASHDLRQPLHALGMFAAALPEKTLDAESTGLVHRIKTSVASLEALLSALLDISRLDAGVVSAEKRDMWLDGLFERLANDFVPEAVEKDLRLAIVPTKCVVRSDPVLLERILRNLVANALRYTARGGAVVGARRRGNHIAIEVWDTGAGIQDTERERIFEEFYQIGNPGRDRAHGLGLGLAIVRRSADLLGHKIELASRIGRGSVFRVIVESGNPDSLLAAASAQPIVAGSMVGQRLVVIDDETLVRESTRDLLVSWGATVIAGGDAEDVLAALDGTMPDLLLVDYRLRDGKDGVKAIGRLRESLGREIPAVLVSGESSTTELALIKASGFMLLHKPVPPAKLRSALAFQLRASREPSQSTVE